MNKDTLKKHHFWFLLGVVPLFVLIAVLVISSGVGAAIEEKQKEIDSTKKDLSAKGNPKPNDLLAKLDKQIAVLNKKRGELWEANWQRQKALFTWPNSPLLKSVERSNPKFGDRIPRESGEYDEFRKPEVYLAEYSNTATRVARPPGMADKVAPTQFAGGWQAVLRHVSDWGQQQPTSDQLWFALEDIWVQRSLLQAVTDVNQQIAEFKRVPLVNENNQPLDDRLHRKFASRIWEVELKVDRKDNKPVLTGTLTNATDRLQLLGTGNTMTLKVWLDPAPGAEPFEFKITGEFVPGRGVMKIVPTAAHTIPETMTVTEIAKVEQVFDARTVPVRRIDRLVMGWLDARNAASQLLPPKFVPEEPPAAVPGTFGPEGPGGGGPGPGRPAGPTGEGGPAGPGGAMPGTAGQHIWGGGPSLYVLEGAKRRYLQVTDQVRRMPVAIAVVIDQSYLQDMLLAYANSPLRFQITQVHWQRFRGAMDGLGSGGSPFFGGFEGGGPGEVHLAGPASFGRGFGPGGPGPGGLFAPTGEGGGPSPGPGGRPAGPGGPFGLGGPSGPFGPGSGYPGGPMSATVSEGQLTSGLIELTVYGIVSLYEKYAPQAPAVQDPGTPPTDPANPVPGETPMPAGTNPGKPRVRRRAKETC
jgi:hypothetical protein